MDCMPSLGMVTLNALAAADSVIIPVQAQYLPAKGMTQLMQTIGDLVICTVLHRAETAPLVRFQLCIRPAGGEEDHVRIDGVDLLETHGRAAAAVCDLLGDDGVHRTNDLDHIRLRGALRIAGKPRGARAEEDALPLVFRDLRGVFRGHDGRLFNELGKRFSLLLAVKDAAERPVCLRHRFERCLEEDRRDAGLALDGVHVLPDARFGVAEVNDELRLGVDERFHIQAGLAAVKLAERRQTPHALREI